MMDFDILVHLTQTPKQLNQKAKQMNLPPRIFKSNPNYKLWTQMRIGQIVKWVIMFKTKRTAYEFNSPLCMASNKTNKQQKEKKFASLMGLLSI